MRSLGLFGQRSENLATITDLQQGWLFSPNDGSPPSDVIEHQNLVIKNPETAEVTSVPAPAGLFPGSFADVSFIAGMLIDKCQHHLPSNRQHQRLLQAGTTISRIGMVTLAAEHRPARSDRRRVARAQSRKRGALWAVCDSVIQRTDIPHMPRAVNSMT